MIPFMLYIPITLLARKAPSRGVLTASRPEADVEIRVQIRGRKRQTAIGRWSAGRRSVSVAGFATPSHEARAPRDGLRNPIPSPDGPAATPQRSPRRAGFPDRKGDPQGASQTPGASRRSIPSLRDRKNGTGGAHASQTTGRRSV